MAKKTNSGGFAFKKFYEAIRDADKNYQSAFIERGFGKPLINCSVDRIGALEQDYRFFEHCICRAQWLIRLINRHDRRLGKFLSACEPFSENFSRAMKLQSNYQVMKKNIRAAVKFYQEAYKDREPLRRAYNEELGLRLKFIRRHKGQTQKEISKKLGISERAYSSYECGSREVPPVVLYQLIDVFDVSASEILIPLQTNS